jgi:2-methylcitrate dehydratase PrpD
LGDAFDLADRGIKIKPYPCGGLTHTAVDTVLKMRDQHGLSPEAVESIKAGVTQHVYNTISNKLPESGIQGKSSMPYILARALKDRKLALDSFTDQAVQDPLVRTLAEKIAMEVDPDISDTREGTRPCKVTVRLKDGTLLSDRVDFPRGSPQRPLNSEELKMKFAEGAGRILKKDTLDQIVKTVERLDGTDRLDSFFGLLIGDPT